MGALVSISTAIEPQDIKRNLSTKFIKYLDASKKTVETYARALRQLFNFFEAEGITQPDRSDILAYKRKLEEAKRSAYTINLYITVVRLFFQWLAQEGIYPDIAAHVKGERTTHDHKKDVFTAEQEREIAETIDTDTEKGKRDFALFVLLASCGLRTIEASRANIEDIHTSGGRVVMDIQRKGHTGKDKTINLPPHVDKAIRAYLKDRGTAEPSAPLFTSTSNNSRGQRMTTRSISATIKAIFTAAGYNSNRLTAHSLRHTAVTLAILGGESVQSAQQFAGHESISTTMIYYHEIEEARNTCAQTVAAAIWG